MTEQATTGISGKGSESNQLNMRTTEQDRMRIAHLRAVTGLEPLSDIVRYALRYTADHHPLPRSPVGEITPAMIRDIAGLVAILKAFVTAATAHMDKESQQYRFFVTGLLNHIGDPIEVCTLLAEHLPDRGIVLRYSHLTHLEYEFAVACLEQHSISLNERYAEEAEQQTDRGRKSFKFFLIDLHMIYSDQINQYREPGEYADFVTRMGRYARSMLHTSPAVSRELEDVQGNA